MQRLPSGAFRYSPRDLIAFLEGDFAAWCERAHLEHATSETLQPDERDADLELVARKVCKYTQIPAVGKQANPRSRSCG
jgi:hypothetical protein